MTKLKSLYEVFGEQDSNNEVYITDKRKRERRSYKGRYSRTKGLFNFLNLIKNWESVVGKLMAQNTIPLKIKGNTLIISTKHSIFAQELGFLTPMILEKVAIAFPDLENQVTKIKFVHSNLSSQDFKKEKLRVKPAQSQKKPHPYSPEYQQKKAKAEAMFSDIQDDEIKNMLIDFMLSQR